MTYSNRPVIIYRRQARQILATHLTHRAVQYALTPAELDQLAALAEAPREESQKTGRREAGQSAVILSRERYIPGEGVIVDGS